jgi:nucleoside-diphosphate-sugar epimerase
MKVLYIGGTGEISYECVLAGAAAGQEITVYNRGVNDEPLPKSVRRITGDMNDQVAYERLGREHFDVVCQFMAFDVARIERDKQVFAGKVGQYVFVSSASAYQKPPEHYVITEDTPLENPYWPYSRAKAAMEQRLMEWHAAGQLPVTIVRPSHTYRRKFPSTFHGGDDLAWRILAGRPIISHGDGSSLWVLTHSSDFAVPFVGLLGNPRAIGQAFHITADRAYAWDRILRAVGAALGAEPKLVHVPTETLLRYNDAWAGPLLGDKTWSVIFDNSKVKSVAGDFLCKIDMPHGMKMVAEHWRKRAGRFRPDENRNTLLDRIAEEQLALGKQRQV